MKFRHGVMEPSKKTKQKILFNGMFTFAQWRNSHYDYKQTEKQQQNRDMAVAERPADDDHHEQTANIPSRAQPKKKNRKVKHKKLDVDIHFKVLGESLNW